MQYNVGEDHQVDHPPLFACREHKNLLRISARFVDELLTTAQDVMPGNPEEIASAFVREAGPTYKLPEFLIPPKVFLFNPRGLRSVEALPYTMILVDRKFFGIPARYLTADRFDGCEECTAEFERRRPPPAAAGRPAGGPSGGGARGAPPPQPSSSGPTQSSGVRRLPPPGAPPPAPGQRTPPPKPGGGGPPRPPRPQQ